MEMPAAVFLASLDVRRLSPKSAQVFHSLWLKSPAKRLVATGNKRRLVVGRPAWYERAGASDSLERQEMKQDSSTVTG